MSLTPSSATRSTSFLKAVAIGLSFDLGLVRAPQRCDLHDHKRGVGSGLTPKPHKFCWIVLPSDRGGFGRADLPPNPQLVAACARGFGGSGRRFGRDRRALAHGPMPHSLPGELLLAGRSRGGRRRGFRLPAPSEPEGLGWSS